MCIPMTIMRLFGNGLYIDGAGHVRGVGAQRWLGMFPPPPPPLPPPPLHKRTPVPTAII